MDYLERVLRALDDQSLGKEKWEMVLVDNASQMPLKDAINLKWHPGARIVREDTLGLAAARIRGVEESRTDVLVFVDDDNVLRRDFLDQCQRIASEWPQIGVWGGTLKAEFECPPPDHLVPHLKALALRHVLKANWSNVWNCNAAEPLGAGLCVRRQVAVEYCEHYRKTSLRIGDRTGNNLLSGGDTEIAYVSCRMGMGMGVFPELELVHLIPERRLEEDYLVNIAEGISTSSIVLKYKWGSIVPESPYSLLVILRLLKHCFTKRGIERRLSWASFKARLAAERIIAEGQRKQRSNDCGESGVHQLAN
jgi:glycosyltransferase involved in cell wall biosynthesis